MAFLEEVKRTIEELTGVARPKINEIGLRQRKPHPFKFRDDGKTPNNPQFPLILYRSPIVPNPNVDPAAVFEALFSNNGWTHSWRDGIYDFLHFHTKTHEVLGIARGKARVQFGGNKGRTLEVKAGDVVILPAGTGHCRKSMSKDLLVVGAYPQGGAYDEPKPSEVDHDKAVASIAKVKAPQKDPVYGNLGPLMRIWRLR
jgi:uncharacterized protein YjlB